MQSFTPKNIIYPSSPNTSEILIAGEDENGIPTNVTLTDATLAAQLNTTPQQIPNPAYATLQATVFQQTLAKLVEEGKIDG